ncbi:MAG: M20/M25/M40 family metallo-hydrolase, partial [Anaerolineae bacterium]|nr:M20/M25/M40 family metallo-hydrolase [Anaerolineae bacterium]
CLLYAHADVVPANSAEWSIPPFGGHIKNGYVWGRGALDDKGLGIIFLKTLCLLQDLQVRLNRDVILLIAADEEVHGKYGVAWLLKHHADLIKAEYVWDEGGVGLYQATDSYHYLYNVAVAEKKPLAIRLVAKGQPGHAAIPQQNNPLDRLIRALTRVKQWKRPARLSKPVIEMLRTLAPVQAFPRSYLFAHAENRLVWSLLRPTLEASPFFVPLIQNTINLTMLRGGEASNVVSGQAEARLDMRLLPGDDPLAVLADLRSVINDRHITLVPDEIPPDPPLTPIDTEFYRALSQTLLQMGSAAGGDPAAIRLIVPYLTPGATDSRYFRQAGMKAYGFTPMLLDAHELSRIHGVDERVSTANLRWGIQLVFKTLLRLG